MDNIEVLGYCLFSSKRMEDFIAFCVGGTEGDPTEPGVFEWLYSRTVQEAHFFTGSANDSIGVFGATVLKPDDAEPDPVVVPWTNRIKGFKRFVSSDGALDLVHVFPQMTATVTHNQVLDDHYAKGVKPVIEVFNALKATDRSGFSFTAEEFAAALRGDAKVDRIGILSEIEKRLEKPLFEKPDIAKLLESIGIDSKLATNSAGNNTAQAEP
jgi:hypothetical protein